MDGIEALTKALRVLYANLEKLRAMEGQSSSCKEGSSSIAKHDMLMDSASRN